MKRIGVPMIHNRQRVNRLMLSAIQALNLDLENISVLTEGASGAFVVTPLIAAMAGASRVVAVTRDSTYGAATDVAEYLMGWADDLGIAKRIEIATDLEKIDVSDCSLVTNLGFVRPIDEVLLSRLPSDAMVSLMWEPWEFRAEDIDLHACRRLGVPIVGTNEEHPSLQIFAYLGMLVQKLLLEADIEVYRSNILLISSDPFGKFIEASLIKAGAKVQRVAAQHVGSIEQGAIEELDAVVLSEHRNRCLLVGEGAISPECLAGAGVVLIHICGLVDNGAIECSGVQKIPRKIPRPGFMTVTTDYVGPRPVVDLHAAGLKVGEIVIRELRSSGNVKDAVAAAVQSGLGIALPACA